jgi:hypothetical protein
LSNNSVTFVEVGEKKKEKKKKGAISDFKLPITNWKKLPIMKQKLSIMY